MHTERPIELVDIPDRQISIFIPGLKNMREAHIIVVSRLSQHPIIEQLRRIIPVMDQRIGKLFIAAIRLGLDPRVPASLKFR